MRKWRIVLALLMVLSGAAIAQEPSGKLNLPDGRTIPYFDMNSDVCRQHTQEFRDAQLGLITEDYGEEIIFCMDQGLFVQFANGSGRRLLIGRGNYSTLVCPAWSLDGTKIAFAAKPVNPTYVDLYVANADGSDPVAILSLNTGFYTSNIQSTSWHWGNQYIMFNYIYDDYQNTDYFTLCTIRDNGAEFNFVDDVTRSYSQYEPVDYSQRYTYISAGAFWDQNTRLRVSNLDGSNDIVWFTFEGTIAGFTHVCWDDQNSIYTIIRWWSQYPNREVLLRIDRINNQTYYTVIGVSDPNASLWSPTVSPDRRHLYNAEMTSQTSTMWLTTLGTDGNPTNVESRGTGFFPNWRQEIPVGIKDKIPALPKQLLLSQNYPNPFNARTVISYSLTEPSNVKIEVYDILGRLVTTLVDEYQQAGKYQAVWDGSEKSSGMYFYKIAAGDKVETRQMVLLK